LPAGRGKRRGIGRWNAPRLVVHFLCGRGPLTLTLPCRARLRWQARVARAAPSMLGETPLLPPPAARGTTWDREREHSLSPQMGRLPLPIGGRGDAATPRRREGGHGSPAGGGGGGGGERARRMILIQILEQVLNGLL